MLVADIVGNAEQVTQDVLAVLYITSRLLFIICYLADLAILRSLVWFAGLALIIAFSWFPSESVSRSSRLNPLPMALWVLRSVQACGSGFRREAST